MKKKIRLTKFVLDFFSKLQNLFWGGDIENLIYFDMTGDVKVNFVHWQREVMLYNDFFSDNFLFLVNAENVYRGVISELHEHRDVTLDHHTGDHGVITRGVGNRLHPRRILYDPPPSLHLPLGCPVPYDNVPQD